MKVPPRYLSSDDVVSHRLVSVVWELTLACDLKCKHCGSRAGRPRSSELTTAECLDLIAQFTPLGVRDVGLIGGEAYLRRDWTEIVRAIRDAGIECAIQTGGRNLTESRVAAAVAAGLSGAGISIDGLAQLHDELRGVPGSFAAAIAALHRLRAHGVVTTVNTQITAPAMEQLPALLEEIVQAGASCWQVSLTVPMGRAADNDTLLLQPFQLLELMPLLARLHASALDHGVILQPANTLGYFGPFESMWRSTNDRRVYFSGCNAGQNLIGIEADGGIKGCPGLPVEYISGNIRTQSLEAIWRSSTQLVNMRERRAHDLWGFCRDCYYADVCMGGCTWMAHTLLGRPGNNPYCHYRVLQLAARGLRERVRKVREAPGHPFDYAGFELIEEPLEAPLSVPRRPLKMLPLA